MILAECSKTLLMSPDLLYQPEINTFLTLTLTLAHHPSSITQHPSNLTPLTSPNTLPISPL